MSSAYSQVYLSDSAGNGFRKGEIVEWIIEHMLKNIFDYPTHTIIL